MVLFLPPALHSPPYSLHYTPYSLHYTTLHIPYTTLHTPCTTLPSILTTLHYTPYPLHYTTLHTHCTTLLSILTTLHYTSYSLHYTTLHTPYSLHYTPLHTHYTTLPSPLFYMIPTYIRITLYKTLNTNLVRGVPISSSAFPLKNILSSNSPSCSINTSYSRDMFLLESHNKKKLRYVCTYVACLHAIEE